jgi:hypothetical protein
MRRRTAFKAVEEENRILAVRNERQRTGEVVRVEEGRVY